MSKFSLHDLEAIIAQKAHADPDVSWTAKLLAGGPEKAAKKLGEEATETIIAALGESTAEFTAESADLLYHWLVLARAKGITLDQVLNELHRRTAESGLAEKAARGAG